MELLNHFNYVNGAQTVFVIQPGKQVTLHAKGLEDDDTVYIEVLELSSSPDFKGNPCCTFKGKEIQVLRRTTLLCPDGREVTLTAAYPTGVLEYPQGVTLGVRVEASDEAMVSIELHETESDGCLACICDRPCEITSWTDTGQVRCTGTNVEKEEESNCGTKRWVAVGPLTWTPTGAERCVGFKTEVQEVNDCGSTRWRITTETCGYCPSLPVSCGCEPGFGYHIDDPKDPAATVEMAPCPGDTSVDSLWLYPTSGPGHTVKITDCDGVLIGYAANRSDCAHQSGC